MERHRVVIIGTGLAGVGLGVRLRQAGLDPGCQCDVPAHPAVVA